MNKYLLPVLLIAIIFSAVECGTVKKELQNNHHNFEENVLPVKNDDDISEGLFELLEALEEDVKNGHLVAGSGRAGSPTVKEVEQLIEEAIVGTGKTAEQVLNELLQMYKKIHA